MSSSPAFTPIKDIPGIVSKLRANFAAQTSFSLGYRKGQLSQLLRLLVENESSLMETLVADFKSRSDAMTEFKLVVKEVAFILDNVEKWAAPTAVSAPLINAFDSCSIRRDPLGVVLIIGAWNYPLSLLLEPFAGAVAAGNAVVLKPSEICAQTTALLTALIAKYMSNELYCVVNGSAPETTALVEKERFDHVFYTGSTAVGQIVYGKVACASLAPVTLELGGKSPVIVDDHVDIEVTANRIIWAKLMNVGQTCIAPDYVLCSDRVAANLVPALKTAIIQFYGTEPKASPDYGRIISAQHMDRLLKLYHDNKDSVATMVGEPDREARYCPPIIFDHVAPNSSLMAQEIFGPLLPVLRISSIEEAIRFVNERAKPLSLYVFSKEASVVEQVLRQTSSGSVCVNDAIMQHLINTLPFGGVGLSGHGSYHGRKTFETFSHAKSVMWRSQGLEKLNEWVRYPPMNASKWCWLEKLIFGKPKPIQALKAADK